MRSALQCYDRIQYFTGAGFASLVSAGDKPLAGARNNNENKVGKCYDGETNVGINQACMTTTEDGTWAIGVDFGKKEAFQRIKVFGPNNYGFHYNWHTDLYIAVSSGEVSSDGLAWTRVAENKNIGAGHSNVLTFEIDQSIFE